MPDPTQDATQKVQSVLNSPEVKILLTVFKDKSLTAAESLAAGFLAVEAAENPNYSRAQLVAEVEGDLWHTLRKKAGSFGFITDILRNEPQFAQPVHDLVEQEFDATLAPTEPPAQSVNAQNINQQNGDSQAIVTAEGEADH